MKQLISKLFISAATAMLVFGMPLAVFAQTPSGDGGRVQDGLNAIRDTYPTGVRGDQNVNVGNVFAVIATWALYLAFIVCVIFIIIGAYYYITAGGNDEQAKKGRKTLVNALIGLVLVVLSYLIVQVVYNFIINNPGT